MNRSYEGCKLSPEDAELLDRYFVRSDGDVKEATNLCAAVDLFAEQMKEKLVRKLAKGFVGWDVVSREWQICLVAALDEHVGNLLRGIGTDDPEAEVDIANLAMFHHFLREALEHRRKEEVMRRSHSRKTVEDYADEIEQLEQHPHGLPKIPIVKPRDPNAGPRCAVGVKSDKCGNCDGRGTWEAYDPRTKERIYEDAMPVIHECQRCKGTGKEPTNE